MRFEGRVFKAGRQWAIEVPILDVVTQGRTKKEAYAMVADAIETLVNKKGFKVQVFPGNGNYFEISAVDQACLSAFLLRRQRTKRGLTLKDVAQRLGARSHNTYARYEQGKSVPTIEKFNQLLSAVSPDKSFILRESRDR
jgi:DNA-binding XRE family transcriptional regulator/predicted RNase H-like HicB family nuclease